MRRADASHPLSLLLSLVLSLLTAGCERETNPFEETPAPKQQQIATGVSAVTPSIADSTTPAGATSGVAVWDLGMSLLTESYNAAGQLIAEVDALLASPSAQRLENAQQQWRETAIHYERFYLFTRLGLVQPDHTWHCSTITAESPPGLYSQVFWMPSASTLARESCSTWTCRSRKRNCAGNTA